MKNRLSEEKLISRCNRVINLGMSVYQQLLTGEQPEMSEARRRLVRSLDSIRTMNLRESGGVERTTEVSRNLPDAADIPGVCHYLLTCWLDELFVIDSPWSRPWNEQKLELMIYGTNDRAWRFWEYVRSVQCSESRSVMNLVIACVLHGFQGQMVDSPSEMRKWFDNYREGLIQKSVRIWKLPPDLPVVANVPALSGTRSLERSIRIALMAGTVVIPLISFLIIFSLRS